MKHCAYKPCNKPIPNPKHNQRFCHPNCKTAWHREHNSHDGIVKSIRQIKNGKWSITVHFTEQPTTHIGQEVALSAVGTRTQRETE